MRAAPPTPTQTPIIAFLAPEDMPEEFLELESLAREADSEGVSEVVDVPVADSELLVDVTNVVCVWAESVVGSAEVV